MKRVILQPAYVLHRRAYRETSFLVELFTQEFGRVSVIARGVRKAKGSSQGILQPFIALTVSLVGKGDLLTLSHVEVDGPVTTLKGDCLFAGFYLNELLTSLLQKWDGHPELYNKYASSIAMLQSGVLSENILRSFELTLLEELGYGLFPKLTDTLHDALSVDKHYRFIPEQGFVTSRPGEESALAANIFSGKSLLAIAKENWDVVDSLRDAKRLSRLVLTPLLGTRTIHSRRLFLPLGEHHEE